MIVATMFWGIGGIMKSAGYLNEIFYQISEHERPKIRVCAAFIVELCLSLILIFEPLDSVEHHILILGVQLVAEGVLDLIIKTRERIKDKRTAR